MSPLPPAADAPTLAEQQAALRARLHQQRQKIRAQLAPNRALTPLYPRSFTMRLLLRRRALVVSLLSSAGALLLGRRLLRGLGLTLLLIRLLRSLWLSRGQLRSTQPSLALTAAERLEQYQLFVGSSARTNPLAATVPPLQQR